MEIETVHHYDYGDFLEGNLELSEKSVQLIGEADPKELKRDMRTFTWAGVGAVLAGIGIFLATNLGLGLMEAMPFLIAGGIAALGVGMMKGFSRIFGKRRLQLPRLQVRRKTEKKSEPTQVREIQQPRAVVSPRKRRRWSLSKSNSDSVIMGVCGGLAESSGISSSLIRLLFIAAFAITGGSAAVIYFVLGMFLPAGDSPRSLGRKGTNNNDIPIR
jgi:phage shock protein PspC (stress-responsive transcriptional regulator)